MKRNIFFAALVLTSAVSFAQVSIVPKAGVTLSKVSSNEEEFFDINNRLGFTLGAGFNFAFGEIFSLQPELSFIQKGVKSTYEDSYTDGYKFVLSQEINLAVNYIELPVLARATFGTGTKFFINAGPSIAFGLGGKAKTSISYKTYQGSELLFSESQSENYKVKFGSSSDEDTDDVYIDNRVDVGLQVGLGALIADKIAVDFRYGMGLTSLSDDSENEAFNRVFQFTVGMPIRLK